MILPRLGRWSFAAGRRFTWMRIYLPLSPHRDIKIGRFRFHGWVWTPFCRVRRRRLNPAPNRRPLLYHFVVTKDGKVRQFTNQQEGDL